MKSFAKILEEKLGDTRPETAPQRENQETWINRLQLNPFIFRPRAYAASQPPQRKFWSATHLPVVYRESFEFFHRHGATGLTEFSSEKELKKLYRRLALKLHPDSITGQHMEFIALQRHYRILAEYLISRASDT